MGNAKRFVHHHGEKVRYVDDLKSWFIYQDKYWQKDNTKKIVLLAKNTVQRISDEAEALEESDPQKCEEIKKHATNSQARGRIKSMIELVEPELPITPNEFDTHPYLLTVQNGTIDLRDGKLRPHDPKHFITHYLDIPFDETAKCPSWLRFLDRIMEGNQALIAFLQRALGYSLTGDTKEQCLFFLYGNGSNGKSTFIETALVGLLGSYVCRLPIESLLLKSSSGGIPSDIAKLKGARVAIASEIPEGRRLNESLTKDISGGDTITARKLYHDYFKFRPECKLWLYGNHKPNITGNDDGIWRRIRIIPFSAQINDAEKNQALGSELKAELPGILAWAVKGALEWQQKGLNPSQEILTATSAYRSEMDPVGIFIEECCVLDDESKVSAKALYDTYKSWCIQNADKALSQHAFGKRLNAERLKRKRGTGGRYWRHGIKLREESNTVN
jgi:putative DNA primase/helicase